MKTCRSSRVVWLAILPLVLLPLVLLNQPPKVTESSQAKPAKATGQPMGTESISLEQPGAVTQSVNAVLAANAQPVLSPDNVAPMGKSIRKPASREVSADFIDQLVKSDKRAAFSLPDGRQATGKIDALKRDGLGVVWVRGKLETPENGSFFFNRQSREGKAGWLVGHAILNASGKAFRLAPGGQGRGALMVETEANKVMCAGVNRQAAPETHPTSIPTPSYQTVTPLQSLPGAQAVIYLDFDGEAGPFPLWGDFDALPSSFNNTQIFDVWRLVAEDFIPFNINVTTDRQVFDLAAEGSRVHVIISPTTTGYPGPGSGYAEVGSFNWTLDAVCWVSLMTTTKFCAEICSHESGHMLGLWHHGTTTQEYYAGNGTGATGWAPIMGASTGRNVSQWSKAEYANPSNPTQDDMLVISTTNNNVAYRADDGGETLATARYLEVLPDSTVSNEGIIESASDVDAFRFMTTGGAVTINVNPASLYPNLDILAELVNASNGTVIVSSNPSTTLNATLTTTLAAGEYLVRVQGVGFGDPLTVGYSDYDSAGSYFITGSVTGGQQPSRFSIAENSANGTAVGTITGTGGPNPGYSITSGNTSGAFAINSSNGAITVANSAALDFETLSTRWDDPATFELFVHITYSGQNPAEDKRVVVTVTNINEAPTVQAASVTIMEHTRAGSRLVRMVGSDVDHFDFPTYSITAGNTGGVFAINSGTGWITMASDLDVASDTTYNLTVQVADQGTPALTASTTATITVIATPENDFEPGRIVRTCFDGITGSAVSDLTGDAAFPNSPSKEEFITSFDGTIHGTDYGSTMRAILLPPVTGSYTFWIASSDASELWLGTNDTQASASVIASVATTTSVHQWDASPSQQSVSVTLTAGQPYWIEARHKKGAGALYTDHVSVAWQGPGFSRQIINGLYLSAIYQNYAPTVQPATLAIRENALPGQTVGTIAATDVNRQDTFGSYSITAGDPTGIFGIDSSTGRLYLATGGVLNAATTPVITLTVQASDNGTPALSDTTSVTINVLATTGINADGIIQQRWNGSFASVAALTAYANYPYLPDTTVTHASFGTPSQSALLYGSRIQAVVTPPASGSYTFYMSTDDFGELWFSTDPSGAGATRIINITTLMTYNDFSQPSQVSAPVTLTAGQPYYLRVLHKQGGNSDHVQVAWTGPGISTPTIIPGSALAAYDLNTTPSFSPASYAWSAPSTTALNTVVGSVSATDNEADPVTYAISSGNTGGTFAIDSQTGSIRVANTAGLVQGTVFSLVVTVQDRGIGWVYPLRSTTAPVTITVPLPNQPPTGPSSVTKPNASRGVAYSSSLAGDFSDPNAGDVLTFTKQSGPAWLVVGTAGALSGTPGVGDVGANAWTIRVTDSGGLFIDCTLNITVLNVNNPPVWANHSLSKTNGTISLGYSGTLAGDASDPDAGDTLTFSKVSGPAWLTLAANGALGGTPGITDVGLNSWSVRVTDTGGLYDTATLQITVSAPALGAPWSTADIGTTGHAGATVTGGGVYNQAGAGVGVSGTADAFQFAYQAMTANGEFRARLLSLAGPANASAGVMLRDGTGVGAKVAWLSVKGGNVIFSSRTTTGGTATVATVGAANAAPNNWLRLTRSGTIITAYRSANGVTWTNVGTVTLSSVTTLQAGLATSSGDTSNLATSGFDNVQMTTFPAQWTVQQVGTVTATGRAEYYNNAYTLNGAGIIGGTSDSMLFCQQGTVGDCQIIARVSAMQNTGTSARAGIEIRDTTSTGAKRVFLGISPDGTIRFQYRTKNNGADTTVTGGTGTLPNIWLKLVSTSGTISGYKSSDGVNWTLVSSKAAGISSNALGGMVVSSGSTNTLNTSVIDNVTFTP